MLLEARERKELSINQTATRAQVGTSYLSQLEKGIIKTPGPERLKRLAHVLDLDPVELLEASGRLTVEQQLLLDRRPSFSEFVQSDPRLDRQAARALVALYLHFTGGRE
jgi:transcriptional regulator with XRE-family HTH domain